ncbi:hypothetical protein [Winogradskyella sp. MH6]|uniref:hypothetical protein n=1 Tax=Winogradskyella sp. MH6 TaxID=2929510 RepID=UPI001FB276CC|nr:hypothetical protein [Winogradskyella sp. MH6]
MRYYSIILLFIFLNQGCKSNDESRENQNVDNQIESTLGDESISEIETTENETFNEENLFGTWKLIAGDPKLEKLIDSTYLNFYDNLYFNKKVNGYYTPRVPFAIFSSQIRLYNSKMSSDLAKVISISSDTLKLHLNADDALGIFARTIAEE